MATAAFVGIPLSRADIELARRLGRHLGAVACGRSPTLGLVMARNEPPIGLSPGLVKVLQVILQDLGSGCVLRAFAADAELTTQQAADYLNVSRPFLIKLLEQKKIPYRFVGTHRRIHIKDVARYNDAIERERRDVLDRRRGGRRMQT
jgi:excisionase family DNA binding protein